MTPSRTESLRPSSLEMTRLAWAFAISIALHLAIYGGYELGKKYDWWRLALLPKWLQHVVQLATLPKQPPRPPQEAPLVFINVDPAKSVTEAPKDAKYYSSRNSVASNPDIDKPSDVPKIEGKQEHVPKTEDTPRSPYDKLQPDFSALNPPKPVEKPKPAMPESAGDIAMARPDPNLRPDTGNTDEPRPRTVAEAKMRQNRTKTAGEAMKQEGGVNHRLQLSSVDARSTTFGAYDAEFINAVSSRWDDLLDSMSYAGYRHGRVRLQFRLHYDGRISDMKVLETDVGDVLTTLCEKAVLDPAPFDKWPREMRMEIGKDYRDVTFTFFYN